MQLDGLLYTGVLPKVCRTSGCYFVSHLKLKKHMPHYQPFHCCEHFSICSWM